MPDYGDNRNSVLLEGMYKGVAGKIDEVRDSVSRELQFGSAQQVAAYESLNESVKASVDSVLAELRYLSQQNSAIYEYNEAIRAKMEQSLLDAVKAASEETERRIAETVAQTFENLTRSLESRIAGLREELTEHEETPAALQESVTERDVAAAPAPAESVEAEESETPAEETAEETPVRAEDGAFDYDLLAEKISTILPEPDYDAIAERLAASSPAADADAIADKVAAALPATDENAIADKVAEAIPPVDYDLIAERVAGSLEHEFDVTIDEEGVEKIARRVAELLCEKLPLAAAGAAAVAAVATPAPAPAEETPAPAVPVPVDVPEDMTTRYKRSFEAKIIESEEDVKGFYSDLKNAFLCYDKVRSQMSWANDRFVYSRETVAKIGVRGKTLCLYLALNPDEFPASVYHQKYAGDTKMYEKTPMMLKIKSAVAVKRAVRLIELLMEKCGAVKSAEYSPVDYAKDYGWRSAEELLAEGLIKTALVEKSDLDF